MTTFLAALAFSVPAAVAAPTWHDSGPFEHTRNTNCVSGQEETATAEYAGAYYDVNAPPQVGQIFYGHIVVYGLGNPCNGGFYVDLQVHLPPGTHLAISQANPVYCLYGLNTGATGRDTVDCPHTPTTGTWPNPSYGWLRFDPPVPSWSYSWPLPTGPNATHAPFWDIRFPMYSTTPLVGLSAPCDCLVGAITAAGADSGSNTDGPPSGWNFGGVPSSGPYAPIFVDLNPPTIDYPASSSSAVTTTTAHTTGYVREHYAPGTVYVDLGTSTAYGRSFSYPIDGTADASQVDQDWSGLAPRTRYHWRLRFVESNGVTVLGADQTFTTVATVAVKVPPSVSTGSPSAVAQTTATLTGTVNPNGFGVTGCRFDYGTTSAYGASVPCAQIAGGGTSAVAVSASPSGLLAGTTYHYRLVATNAGGTTAGTDMTFATRSGGGCHGCGNPKPCAGLASAQLENCNAAVAYRSALATCDRKYHGKSRAAKAKHAACRKRATTTYHRALALIKCSKIRNKHKRLLCTKHARRVQ